MPKATKKKRTPIPAIRVGRLDSVGGVVKELGRLYRSARNGFVPIGDAAKLAYVLTSIRQALEAGDLEARLARLEGANDAEGEIGTGDEDQP